MPRYLYCLLIFVAACPACNQADVAQLQAENTRLKAELKHLRQAHDSTRAHLEHGLQEALFMEALELEEFGLLEESKKHFITLIREYPNSNYARKAQLKLEEVERLLKNARKDDPKRHAKDKAPPAPEKVFTTREFYDLFEREKDEATMLFKNKTVTVEGVVKEVHDYSSTHITNVEIELRDATGNETFVSCNFSSGVERAKVAALRAGAPVRIRGRYEFRFLNVPHIEECVLAP